MTPPLVRRESHATPTSRFFCNWPGAGGLDVYNRWVPLLLSALDGLSPSQANIDALFAGNARRAYRVAA